jgi:hypothetical protein
MDLHVVGQSLWPQVDPVALIPTSVRSPAEPTRRCSHPRSDELPISQVKEHIEPLALVPRRIHEGPHVRQIGGHVGISPVANGAKSSSLHAGSVAPMPRARRRRESRPHPWPDPLPLCRSPLSGSLGADHQAARGSARQRGSHRSASSRSGAKDWSRWRRRCDHRASIPRGDAVRRYPRSQSHESPAVPNEPTRPWVRASKVGNPRGSARNLHAKPSRVQPPTGEEVQEEDLGPPPAKRNVHRPKGKEHAV